MQTQQGITTALISTVGQPYQCKTPEGAIYGFEVMDAGKADAILYNEKFRWGTISDGGRYWLLQQGDDVWRVPKADAKIIFFNVTAEYREKVIRQVHGDAA